MSALTPLLRHAIDYAGLFPPAGLGMAEAVANFASYRASDDAWALGRFVVPVSRLAEFEKAAEAVSSTGAGESRWRLAALVGSDVVAELRTLDDFNRRHAQRGEGAVLADVVEAKAESPTAVERLMAVVPDSIQAYVEISPNRDLGELIGAIHRSGGRAKIRTGGVTPESFPPAENVVRFVRACLDAGVPFKATAGLHHPLRADYRLTYAPDSACGTMFGFLNVFLATTLMAHGLDEHHAETLLEEREVGSIEVNESGISWRGWRVTVEAIARTRETGIVSFGSCSFTEPMGDLRSLGML